MVIFDSRGVKIFRREQKMSLNESEGTKFIFRPVGISGVWGCTLSTDFHLLLPNMATSISIQQQQKPTLTPHDAAVLSALFDPESSPSSLISVSKTAPSLPHISDLSLPHLQRREIAEVRRLDSESPSQSSIESAIFNLSQLIREHPKYAPAYVNRAQATRLLLIGAESNLFMPRNLDQISHVFHDLNKAISLVSPRSPTDPLSDLQAALLAKAHTHRGYLLLKASQATQQAESIIFPPDLSERSTGDLEEMASKDFFLGGRYGNKIARELSVKTNPYAKMCGAIVQEAMKKEREEYEREGAGR